MPVKVMKTKAGMVPVGGNRIVLEDDGLRVVKTVNYTASPARDPTAKKPGLIRRILAMLKRKNV